MPGRIVRDVAGVEWEVFEVAERNLKVNAQGAPFMSETLTDRIAQVEGLSGRLRTGWICFESPLERRRLAPIPPNWSSLPDAQMLELLAAATPAPRRKH